MGLITEEVEVTLHPSNISYYEKLGYIIPRIKKHGINVVNKGTSIVVKAEDLMLGARTKVLFKCDNCEKEKWLIYSDYTRHRSSQDNKYYCKKCCGRVYSGEKNVLWKTDKTEEERIRDRFDTEYIDLIRNVLLRDNYTCQCCNKTNTSLEVHHLDGYHWCAEKRKDINNCISLCKECHTNFHSYYGKKNNTKEQFEEWLGRSMQILNSGNVLIPFTRKIYCLENNIIYECVKDCKRQLHIKSETKIRICCSNHKILGKNPKNISYQTEGYHLFWLDEYEQLTQVDIEKFLDEEKQKGTRRKVICINTGKVYDEINHIKNDYNIRCSDISACCKGKQKSAGQMDDKTRLQWMYYDDYLNKINNKENIQSLEYDNKSKIVCVTTGMIFDSQMDAKRFYNADSSGISKVCRGKQKTCGKLPNGTPIQWMYYDEFLKLSIEEQNEILNRKDGK